MAYTYDYDADGNITAEYIYTDGATGQSSQTTINVYTYGDSNWKDKLTAYKGQAITYDQIGNPLTYRDGITMTWQNGRQLATLTQGDNSISYKYDSNSVRTRKTVNGVEHTYAYLNGKLMYETRGNAKFYYSYDANGTLYSVNYTLTDSSTMQTYYYTHNAQGDIIGIYDSTGTLVAKYTYGDWGNIVSITDTNGTAITDANHIANLNPFRYRSYYYDSETGFYYLLTRYYDPVTHRFINADGYFQSGSNLLDTNMSAYCGNNPISRVDYTGKWWFIASVIATTAISTAITGSMSSAMVCINFVVTDKITTSTTNKAEIVNALKDYDGAFKANESREIADKYTKSNYKDYTKDNSEANAYKHAMWNAVMTDKMGVEKAKLFADAHENFPENPIKSKEMDLHNNELGRQIALDYAGQGYDVFSQKIQEAIKDGKAVILEWD